METDKTTSPLLSPEVQQALRLWKLRAHRNDVSCFYLAGDKLTVSQCLPDLLQAIGLDPAALVTVDAATAYDNSPSRLLRHPEVMDQIKAAPSDIVPVFIRGFDTVIKLWEDPYRFGHDWDQDSIERQFDRGGKRLVFLTWLDFESPLFGKMLQNTAGSQFKTAPALFLNPAQEMSRKATIKFPSTSGHCVAPKASG